VADAPNPSDVATATLAAHLLSEAGSAIVRAQELLEILGWRDQLEDLRTACGGATRRVQAVRMLVDGHLEVIHARLTGREPDQRVTSELELGSELLRDLGAM
jgi:hypothetical protein